MTTERVLALLLAALLALGAGPVLAEAHAPDDGRVGDVSDESGVSGDDGSGAPDATSESGDGVVEGVSAEFIVVDGTVYFGADVARPTGLASGDAVEFAYVVDANGDATLVSMALAHSSDDGSADVDSDGADPPDGAGSAVGTGGGDSGSVDAGDTGDGDVNDSDAGSGDSDDGDTDDGDARNGDSNHGAAQAGDADIDGTSAKVGSSNKGERRGLRAYYVLTFQVLPNAPESARPGILRAITRLAQRLGLNAAGGGDPVANAGNARGNGRGPNARGDRAGQGNGANVGSTADGEGGDGSDDSTGRGVGRSRGQGQAPRGAT